MGTDHETLTFVTGTLHVSSWFVHFMKEFVYVNSEYIFDHAWVIKNTFLDLAQHNQDKLWLGGNCV